MFSIKFAFALTLFGAVAAHRFQHMRGPEMDNMHRGLPMDGPMRRSFGRFRSGSWSGEGPPPPPKKGGGHFRGGSWSGEGPPPPPKKGGGHFRADDDGKPTPPTPPTPPTKPTKPTLPTPPPIPPVAALGAKGDGKECKVGALCLNDGECGQTVNGKKGVCLAAAGPTSIVSKCNCAACVQNLGCNEGFGPVHNCGGLAGACNTTTQKCDCEAAYKKAGFADTKDAQSKFCFKKQCDGSDANGQCFGLPCTQSTCSCPLI